MLTSFSRDGLTGSTTGRMSAREVEERTAKMSYFPTKILLATDASKDAVKAAQIASDMSSVSGSELHILHVGSTKDFHVAPGAEQSFSPRSPSLGEVREKAEKTLEEAVKQVEEAGGAVAGAHLRMGDPDDERLRACLRRSSRERRVAGELPQVRVRDQPGRAGPILLSDGPSRSALRLRSRTTDERSSYELHS